MANRGIDPKQALYLYGISKSPGGTASAKITSSGIDGIHPVQADVDTAEGVAALAQAVRRDFPTLNVLINNAGIMRSEPLDTARDLRDAEATIVTNLLGPIRLIDALIDHLVQQPDAAIVNVFRSALNVPVAGESPALVGVNVMLLPESV